MKTTIRAALIGAGMLATAVAANAAIGDTLTYDFNAPSTGNSTTDTSRGTLLLTEISGGVELTLSPNWDYANFAQQLEFAYSGDVFTLGEVAGTAPSVVVGSTGHIDSGYEDGNKVTVLWPTNAADRFDSGTSTWQMLGSTIDLSDFMFSVTSPSKPSPAFGVLSVPGAVPSNWVAVAAVPEPETYALMLAGLAVVGVAARRRQRG